jgi:hypothetical protein
MELSFIESSGRGKPLVPARRRKVVQQVRRELGTGCNRLMLNYFAAQGSIFSMKSKKASLFWGNNSTFSEIFEKIVCSKRPSCFINSLSL